MTGRVTTLMAAVAVLTGCCCEALQAEIIPPNHNFADGARGWTLQEQASVQAADGATGSALEIEGGWALSSPSEAGPAGWWRISVRARVTTAAEDGRLLLDLPGAGAEPAALVVVPAASVGTRWRQIVAEVAAPATQLQVAIGADGAATWLVDSVELIRTELPAAEAAANEAVVEPALPQGWEPDGLLDAFERGLGRGRELIVTVGALTIRFAPEVTAQRGHRGALRLSVTNGAASARELTLSASGAPGFFVPQRTVNIRAGRDTVFDASLQAFFVGSRWARVTFASGGERASAPVLVTSEPSYPATGAAFTTSEPTAEELAAVSDLNLQLVAACVHADKAGRATELPSSLTRLLLLGTTWSEDALRTAASALVGEAGFMALYHRPEERPEADLVARTRILRTALDDCPEPVYLLSHPLDLRRDGPLRPSDDDMAMIAQLAGAGTIVAPALRLPPVRARAAGRVSIDGSDVAAVQPPRDEIALERDIDALSASLREHRRMPMFFSEIAGRSSGCETGDAMTLARILALCAHQGVTGFTLFARPSEAPEGADAFSLLDEAGDVRGIVARTVSEISRELAAAVPLAAVQQSQEIGTRRGAAVSFRPFIRGDEGVLVLWNNTASSIELMVEVRTEPLDVHTVSVGLHGVRRDYIGSFHFSDDAIALNRPSHFVTLAPHEFKIISMQLARPHAAWLVAVERKPPIPAQDGRSRARDGWEQRFPR